MAYCLDPDLKKWFAELEVATKEVHKYPFSTAAEANAAFQSKMAPVAKIMAEMKSALGETKAKEIAARAKAAAIKKTGINF